MNGGGSFVFGPLRFARFAWLVRFNGAAERVRQEVANVGCEILGRLLTQREGDDWPPVKL